MEVPSEKPMGIPDIQLEIGRIRTHLRVVRQQQAFVAGFGAILFVIGILSLGFGKLVYVWLFPAARVDDIQARWIAVLLILVGLSIAGLALAIRILAVSTHEGKVDELTTRRDLLLHFGHGPQDFQYGHEDQEGTEPSYFDKLVQINIENLGAYYSLVKTHTEKSFLMSLGTGCVGFILIVIGLLFGFSNSKDLAYISSGSGVITEFIASVCFVLYNRTVRQMKEYHDSLLSVQNILLSFKLVGDTRDASEKVKMISQMISFLVGRQADKIAESGQSLTSAATAGK